MQGRFRSPGGALPNRAFFHGPRTVASFASCSRTKLKKESQCTLPEHGNSPPILLLPVWTAAPVRLPWTSSCVASSLEKIMSLEKLLDLSALATMSSACSVFGSWGLLIFEAAAYELNFHVSGVLSSGVHNLERRKEGPDYT